MLSSNDRLAILDLYARYNQLIDSRDFAWAEVFTPDGIFHGRTTFTGSEELRSFVTGAIEADKTATVSDSQHWNNNILLTENGDEVHGSCYLIRVAKDKESGALVVVTLGGYQDRIVQADGGWLFAERTASFL